MRDTVDSSDRIRLPFRFSLAQASSRGRTPSRFNFLSSRSVTSITRPRFFGAQADVDGLVAAEAVGVERGRHRIGEASLFPHFLKEPRGHTAAEHDVEEVRREPALRGLARALDAEADVHLFEAPAGLQLQVLVAAGTARVPERPRPEAPRCARCAARNSFSTARRHSEAPTCPATETMRLSGV